MRFTLHHRGQQFEESFKLNYDKTKLRDIKKRRDALQECLNGRDYAGYLVKCPNSRNADRIRELGDIGRPRGRPPTVGSLMRKFLEDFRKAVGDGAKSMSTLEVYERMAKSHIFPRWDKTVITDITAEDVRNWVSDMDCARPTKKKIVGPLSMVMSEAVDDGLIPMNPFNLNTTRMRRVMENSRQSEFEANPYSDAERDAILAACDGQIRNMFQFAFYTGARTSELIALRWEDVNLSKKGKETAIIRRAIVRARSGLVEGKAGRFESHEKKTTKTKAGKRVLELEKGAVEALKAQQAYTQQAGDFIFHDPKTNSHWKGDKDIREVHWKRIVKLAGVEYRRPYETRHTFASTMIMADKNILWVSQQLGHATPVQTMKNYARWIRQHDHEKEVSA